jgi:hypothetical protein
MTIVSLPWVFATDALINVVTDGLRPDVGRRPL